VSEAQNQTGLSLFQVSPRDTVAIALRDLDAGETLVVGGQTLTLTSAIARGHKVALNPVKTDGYVIRYGWPIGRATSDIAPGDHVHSHNLATALRPDSALF